MPAYNLYGGYDNNWKLSERVSYGLLIIYIKILNKMEDLKMFDYKQYKRGYFMPPVECMDWVKKEYIDKAPAWCSVDLRDGNQALVEPMSLEQKLEFSSF